MSILETQTSAHSNSGENHQSDCVVLSLLRAYCNRVPSSPSELRYLEIGGPDSLSAWRTHCVSKSLGAKGMLASSLTEQLTHLQSSRPQDTVIHVKLTDGESTLSSDSAGNSTEVTGHLPPANKSLDDLIADDFSFNRLDHLVIHGDASALWQIKTSEFGLVRPYLLHFVSKDQPGTEQIQNAKEHFLSRDFLLMATQTSDLIFVDSLAFIRPEQSSSFII